MKDQLQMEETEIDVELLLCFLRCLLFTFKNDWKKIFPFENK
jgi:hypothetical protein